MNTAEAEAILADLIGWRDRLKLQLNEIRVAGADMTEVDAAWAMLFGPQAGITEENVELRMAALRTAIDRTMEKFIATLSDDN